VSIEPLLELRDVSVHYGQFRALRGISYRIMAGQVVCLLGGNACGKSTSMKAIFGTVPLTGGEVRWQGQRIDRLATDARVRAGLAAVPEGRRVFGRLSVEENLLTGACTRSDRARILSDLDMIYTRFPHLAQRRGQAAGSMSGGEQQMVALGRAMMSRPKLVCMDEPSMGLSPRLVRESFALIEQIRAEGTSVFVVEQNARAALRIADYAYVVQGGQIVLEGTPDFVSQDPQMKEAYLGRSAETG
jgi:branched-chain amino acid transport system ATP-binding protein